MKARYSTLVSTMAVLLLGTSLALVGCSSDDEEDQRDATAADLSNRSFAFSNGAAFGLANQAVTLTFGDFSADGDNNPNTGPFTLTAGSNRTATGVTVIASCDLTARVSTIPEFAANTTLNMDPCEVGPNGELTVINRNTGQGSVSSAPSGTGGGGTGR